MTDTDLDKSRFAAVMLGLAANYGKTLDKVALRFFFKMLAAYDIEAIEQAAMAIAAVRKYTTMPTVADFIEHLSGGNPDDLAEVEAGKVLQAVATHSLYSSVVFDDPTTQAVIVEAYGGWIALCEEAREERAKWFRKDFVQVWTAYKRQDKRHYGALPGLFEKQNILAGYHDFIPAPALIGDADKARAVLAAAPPAALPCGAGGTDAGQLGAAAPSRLQALVQGVAGSVTVGGPGRRGQEHI